MYTLTWFISIFYGAKGSLVIPLFASLACYTSQLILFLRSDRLSLLICIPLSIYAIILGLIQEMLLISLGMLIYPNQGLSPPLWLLSLYPLFALTLNSSLSFINRNLMFSFFIGGIGAIAAYSAGAKMGGVHLSVPLAYPALFASWGIFLTILTLFNRRMISLTKRYTNPQILRESLTVFFDSQCPVCFREMKTLQNRKQTGKVNYACPTSDQDLKEWTQEFSYQEAMKKIHAIDSEGKILTGIDALSSLYARTDLPLIAIWLQAPGFRSVFQVIYAIWAKIRR
jgi:predicted DCC family thiol-disulfide oxidoreductase YuxK